MTAKLILVCLMAVATSNAYSNGAPDMACFDMTPQHGVDPQSSKAPYQLQLARNQLRSGGQIEITIRGLKQSHTIKGFLVQGRVGMTPVGKWLVDKNNAYGQQLSCGNGYGNAITHKRIDGDGPNTLTFAWEAPTGLAANVTFRATVALNGGVFWAGVLSPPLSVF